MSTFLRTLTESLSLPSLKTVGQSVFLGVGASVLMGSGAIAADSVLIQYQGRERTITTSGLEAFVTTGEAVSDDVQEFFTENPEIATIAQDIISAEIFINPSFIEQFEGSSLGEFVLIQLNKVLGTPSGNEDLEPLRVAVVNSFEGDNRFSVLEIIENYPSDTIRLDFSGLQPIVRDVRTFVERVQPALEVAREFLQDIVCDCEPGTTVEAPAATEAVDEAPPEVMDESDPMTDPSDGGSSQSGLPTSSTKSSADCVTPQVSASADTPES